MLLLNLHLFFLAQYDEPIDLIDIDEALVTKLQHDFEEKSNIHPQMGNVMRFPMGGYSKIVGNLPYYITSGILETKDTLFETMFSCNLEVTSLPFK